jgi:hypothetical protein
LINSFEPSNVLYGDVSATLDGLFKGVPEKFLSILVLIIDAEVRVYVQVRSVLAENLSAKAMKRADDGPLCKSGDKRLHATAHFIPSFGGEC